MNRQRTLSLLAGLVALGLFPVVVDGCKTQQKVVVAPPPPPASAPAPSALPPLPPLKTKIEHNRIVISTDVEFDPDKPTILHTRECDAVLAGLLDTMKAHVEITKLRVEAHMDNKTPEPANKALSQARADAVVQWLTSQGLDANRLVARGMGSSKPIQPNDTDEHRSTNRRMEFHLLEVNGSPPPPEPPPAPTPAPTQPTSTP
jgi:OmpA-OmpF porin, OOP family